MSTNEERVNRLKELIGSSAYTDTDIDEIKSLLAQNVIVSPTYLPYVHFRATLELIQVIRKFDKASGVLAAETKLLTARIYLLTYVMIGVGMVGAIASGWYPLTAWLKHIFHG